MSKSNNNFNNSTLKGSRSIFSPKSDIYEEIRRKSFDFLISNFYSEIIIPTYDYKSVFLSSLGEDTDIVQKEIFTFSDKKGRVLALRPEGTACVAKSVIQNNLINSSKDFLKLFYWGSMFRYERPQRGRYREFFQLGIEIINLEKFSSDCEILYIADSLLKKISEEKLNLYINYLGNEIAKNNYSVFLKETLRSKFDILCSVCKLRYEKNTLRIIDCDSCGYLVIDLNYEKFLSREEIEYFEKIKSFLVDMKIDFYVDKKLVRGISYYSGLVFEFKKNQENKSILGGGRYDNLVVKNKSKKNKGQHFPSVGFAIGVDRIVEFCKLRKIEEINKKKRSDILFISFSEESFSFIFSLKNSIQEKNPNLIVQSMLIENKKTKISKLINYFNPRFSLFFGEKEIKNESVFVKKHDSGEFILLKKNLIVDWFIENL